MLTDFASIGRFKLAECVDYVHLPSFSGDFPGASSQWGLKLERSAALRLRQKITASTLKTFRPDLVFLDDSLFNIPEEMRKILACLETELPETKIVWALSDTIGHPDLVLRQWAEIGAHEVLARFADEIWVFGERRVFDVAEAYGLSEIISRKLFYTGYLSVREKKLKRMSEKLPKNGTRLPAVLLVTEGGANDLTLIDTYLRFLENAHMEVRTMIIAGLSLSSQVKRALSARTQALANVSFKRFSKHFLQYVKNADAVVCTGEYNVMSEALAYRKALLLAPAANEQPDNFHRVQLLQTQRGVTVSMPENFSSETVERFLKSFRPHKTRPLAEGEREGLAFEGLTQITERVKKLIAWSPQLKAITAS